jgi:hypothetical protein
MSPTLQRLILHLLQPVVYGGLFLLGFIMRRYPLSFLGLAVLLLVVFGLIARALRRDRLEKEENELILETLQEEKRRQLEQQEQRQRAQEGKGDEEEEQKKKQDLDFETLPRMPSPCPLARESSNGSSGGRPSSNSFDGSDRGSFSSRGRRYSSSAEDLRATYLLKASGGGRNRVNSVESTGSLPYRMRGSSIDSVGSGENFVWRSQSHPTEYFNDLALDEREEKASDDDPSSSSSQSEGEEEDSERMRGERRSERDSMSVSERSRSDSDSGDSEEPVVIVVKVHDQSKI